MIYENNSKHFERDPIGEQWIFDHVRITVNTT